MDGWESLKEAVRSGRESDTRFALGMGALQSAGIDQTLQKNLQDSQIVLRDYSITESEADRTVTVVGAGDNLPFKDMAVEATFTARQPENTLYIKATGRSDWGMGSSFPIFASTVAADLRFAASPALYLASYDAPDQVRNGVLRFVGSLSLNGALDKLAPLFGASVPSLAGDIDMQNMTPSMALTTGEMDLVSIGLTNSLRLNFAVCSEPLADDQGNAVDAHVYLRLSGDLPITIKGQQYQLPITSLIYQPSADILFSVDLEDFTKLIEAGFDEMMDLTGGVALSGARPQTDGLTLPDMISLKNIHARINPTGASKLFSVGLELESAGKWDIVSKNGSGRSIALEGLGLIADIDMATKSPRFTMSGKIDLGDNAPLMMSATAPDFSVIGSLAPGRIVKLKEIIEQFAGADTSQFPDLEIQGLHFVAQPTTYYAFDVDVAGDWPISLGFTELKIEKLGLAIEYDQATGLTADILGVLNVGDVDLSLKAQRQGSTSEWIFTTTAAAQTPVDLIKVINDLLPDDMQIPQQMVDLKLRNLTTSWSIKSKRFTFSGETDLTVVLGPETFTTTVTLAIDSSLDQTSGKRTTSGKLSGEIDIGNTKFQLDYQFDPLRKTLKGAWADDSNHLGFESIANGFGLDLPSIDPAIQMPDLGLKSVSFEVDLDKAAGATFILTANSARFGEAFFVFKKDAQQREGFAFGIALPREWKHLSQIGGQLGDDLKAVDFLEFEAVFFMLSTSEFKGFQVPDFPGLGQHPMQVKPGFTIGAVIDFVKAGSGSDDNSAAIGQLKNIVKKDALLLEITVSSNPAEMSLLADLEGSVGITGAGGKQLSLSDAAIEIQFVPPAITLRGSVVFSINGDKIDATGRLTIGATEAMATFDLKAENRYLPIPMGFKGIHLTEVGVAMGVVFEPPQVDVGLAGKFVIGEPPSPIANPPSAQRTITEMPHEDEFVFIFGLAEEVVNPLLLSMYMSEVSINELIVALLDKPVSLPSVVSEVKATELMLFWCDAPILMPNGIWANPFFGFNANLNLWGFNAHANLKIDATSGFTGDAYLDPIHIAGVLDLTGAGKGTPNTYKGSVRVRPGGPVIHISTLASPYLDISWNLVLFNTISQAIRAEVTQKGFTFEVAYKIGDVFASSLSCSLDNRAHFSMSFSIKLNLELGPFEILGADVGKIRLSDVRFDATLDAKVMPKFVLTIDGGFSFEGVKRRMPQIRLKVAPSSLEQLPRLIADKIQQEAETIFKDIFDEDKRLIQDGLDEAKRQGIEAEYVARILAGEGEQVVSDIRAEAESDAREIERQADQIAQDVYEEMQEVEKAFTQAQQEIESLAKRAEEEAERLARAAEQEAARLASEVANGARDAANKAKDIVNDVGNAVKAGAQDVWNAVKKY
ncbi:MAG TPA: hypothetical protein VJ810_22075 [Blastocatellia bacterium]|nr:hypothetical protein [Blastocatellia bacterium]